MMAGGRTTCAGAMTQQRHVQPGGHRVSRLPGTLGLKSSGATLRLCSRQTVANALHGKRSLEPVGAGCEGSLPIRGGAVRCAVLASSSSATLGSSSANTVTQTPASDRFPRKPDGTYDLCARPPFTLQQVRSAIPASCWQKNSWRSMASLAGDVAVVVALAAGAYALKAWWAWPFYWLAQGTMFWALFVVGHDCGHQSFSNNRTLNDLVGNITHSSILVPYHGWRISHRKHHGNHGHVENDESWHPMTESIYSDMDQLGRIGRSSLPWSLLAYPFYLWKRSPGKSGSHYDPNCDLFVPSERRMVMTSNAFLLGMVTVLGLSTLKLGLLSMMNLYILPYWVFVMWLDVVTYLHHHGSSDPEEQMPWYRGEEWNYLRGGLTTLDRDYGIFNKIHHDIGTHVVHHMFPQIPHYNLDEATEAVKPVMGPYYREPKKSPGPFPLHLIEPLIRSFKNDRFVANEGNVLFYQKDK